MIHDKNLKEVVFKIENHFWTMDGKKYEECNKKEKAIFNQFFKYLKQSKQ